MKLGLENISLLLNELGNPHQKFPTIHIAGTNGKGSTAAMLASVLIAAGYKTGLYTSPHIIDFRERIRINGITIPEKNVISFVTNIRKSVEENRITFFECTTALAFTYFADENVDVAIIETGLGGRLDATNVIQPLLSIITNISIEHEAHLGKSIERIAFEKGGIIKNNVPCITASENMSALQVLKEICKNKKAHFFHSCSLVRVIERNIGINKNVYEIESSLFHFTNLSISLSGYFQTKNISVVIFALELLQGYKRILKKTFFISKTHIIYGLNNVQRLTGFEGRLQIISRQPLIICDVAHNPDAIANLFFSVNKLLPKRGIIVFGVMKDKNSDAILEVIKKTSFPIIAVQPAAERALSSLGIVKKCHSMSISCIDGKDVQHGINFGLSRISQHEFLLICGSFFVLNELANVRFLR